MESMVKVNLEADEILEELDEIYGTNKCKDIMKNYASYIEMKKKGEIHFGNYNILIRNASEYDSSYRLVKVIAKILKTSGVIGTTYRYLEKEEIRGIRGNSKENNPIAEIEEELLVIDTKKLEVSIHGLRNNVKEAIKNNPQKIFILVDEDEVQGLTNANLGNAITWTMPIERISKENKIDYVEKFLKENTIQVSKESTFMDSITDEPFWKVKNELVNIVLTCKTKGIAKIDDSIMKEKLNKEYYKKQETKQVPKNAIQEFDKMIGMKAVKEQIEEILNYIKINQKRNNMPALHMCFTGNPGTGKTTVARIIGKIFSEMQVLSNKEIFVEAQRADLIGKFVGQTAPQTESMVEKAEGGVLFIDEAYSIASYIQDEAGRDYGAECIATLIKEMEDKRDHLCVILAGYTKEMEQMLKTNPGFESRIQFKIEFPDYTEEELYEIFKVMARQENYKLSSNLKELCMSFLKEEKQKENFANARCVRNLFEKIKFAQADRVAKNGQADMDVIKKCDVEKAIEKSRVKENIRVPIGFGSK